MIGEAGFSGSRSSTVKSGSLKKLLEQHLFRDTAARLKATLASPRAPPNKALQLTPESLSAKTCGITLAAGGAVPALAVSAFW